MTIREAEIQLKTKKNELDYWITKKNIALELVQPKATSYSEERVDGGKRVDKYKYLDQSIDEIDPIIDTLNKEIRNLAKYIDNQLKLIGEYEPLKAKIITLREKHNMKWDDISQATHYSVRQCKRIYREYLNKRYIDEDGTLMAHFSL